MSKNLTQKILESHLVEGELVHGQEIAIKIDHTLMQDATGTLAMLEFEALGFDSVKAELCAQYVDHNILQWDSKNADDHKYLQTACAKYGIRFSPPGNGISHQVHMERFGVPGKIILGAGSHTSGAAGISMLGIGAGGLDVAMAMAGKPYYLTCPKILGVRLTGQLPDWVSAKDVILEMLRRYDIKGCVGKIIEYYGPGVMSLTATDRETIGSMGTELGATSSVFPSDQNTRLYLKSQRREKVWAELYPDKDAQYDEYDEIDLSTLEPLIACPSSPGNVVPVREVAGLKVDQVIVGSSVNSSFRDLMIVAKALEGRMKHADTDFHINPGSRQVLENLGVHGGFFLLLMAGARIHEPGCLGCFGMGQTPGTNQVSLRTFPRNFPGQSGAKDDKVYLCSPETAIAAAIKGTITDPRDLSPEIEYPRIKDPDYFFIAQRNIIMPPDNKTDIKILMPFNIKPLPQIERLPDTLKADITIKVGDNISTDDILPAGSNILALRSNIEEISNFVFYRIDPDFYKACKKSKAAAIIGGENYGQGSSREHAALAPRYLGVRVKIAKGFSRIHKDNLCNFGILPLTFKDPADYDKLEKGLTITIKNIRNLIETNQEEIPIEYEGGTINAILDVSQRQRKCLLAGGALNFIKK